MKTHFTTYSPERGEHEQETETAEKLPGYISCNMVFEKELTLFAIGGTESDGFSDNWDIYADKEGTLYSIARPGTSCQNSYFGDCRHISRLMRQGYFRDTLTEYGRELMQKNGEPIREALQELRTA